MRIVRPAVCSCKQGEFRKNPEGCSWKPEVVRRLHNISAKRRRKASFSCYEIRGDAPTLSPVHPPCLLCP